MPDAHTRTVLLDIEGTTTPIEFVHETLFPYARRHVKAFIERHHQTEEVGADVSGLKEEHRADAGKGLAPPPWTDGPKESQLESVNAYVQWLMDSDRKSTALKSLQGKVWEEGYRTGELRAPVYADVPSAFARWESQRRAICIFSSGSVLAQKLLFAHTTAGDLTPHLKAYFDTTSGAKAEAESYRRIAASLRLRPADVLFLSDIAAELDAARQAGMRTALCVRPGSPEPQNPSHKIIRTFDEVLP